MPFQLLKEIPAEQMQTIDRCDRLINGQMGVARCCQKATTASVVFVPPDTIVILVGDIFFKDSLKWKSELFTLMSFVAAFHVLFSASRHFDDDFQSHKHVLILSFLLPLIGLVMLPMNILSNQSMICQEKAVTWDKE